MANTKKRIRDLISKKKYRTANRWKDKAIDMASEGASVVEICAEIGMAKRTYYSRQKIDEEWAEFCDHLSLLMEAWWNKTGRINLNDKTFQVALFKLHMQNRFQWGDRLDVDVTTDGEKFNMPIINWISTPEEEDTDS